MALQELNLRYFIYDPALCFQCLNGRIWLKFCFYCFLWIRIRVQTRNPKSKVQNRQEIYVYPLLRIIAAILLKCLGLNKLLSGRDIGSICRGLWDRSEPYAMSREHSRNMCLSMKKASWSRINVSWKPTDRWKFFQFFQRQIMSWFSAERKTENECVRLDTVLH